MKRGPGPCEPVSARESMAIDLDDTALRLRRLAKEARGLDTYAERTTERLTDLEVQEVEELAKRCKALAKRWLLPTLEGR